MPGYADARRSLADLKAKYDAEMKRVEDEFNAKYEAFLDGQSTFAPSIREKRQAELQELMEKNQAFKDQARQYLKNAEQDAYQPLREKLAAAIQRVGHAKGLAFVLNTDNRLIKDGIPGNITMMCYRPYRRVPDFALPTNLWVMVAENGPWSLPSPKAIARQYGEIRAWKKKLGHKVWAWTYPSKYGELMIKGVPCVGPHAWGKYYADLKDDIIGGFCECECDRSIYNFLNYYVYSRVMWDASTDIDAVLDELYADLFGAASVEMKRMFSELEKRWTTRVVGNIVDTPIGPKAVRPDNSVLWGDIYSPEFRREMDALLKAATAKVGADSLEARRIALMRAEFYDNMVEGAAAYESQARAVEALRFDPSKGPISLTARSSGLRGFTNVANVATSVVARRTPDALEFSFTCAEPKMALCSNQAETARRCSTTY